MDAYLITYRYALGDDHFTEFRLRFEPRTFRLIPHPGERPEWTCLEFHQCGNCPLTPDISPHCPAAVALIEPATRFSDVLSYSEVAVEVITEERIVSLVAPAQDAICSLLGLLCATSGCPVSAPFRPMARFHLPFATEAETVYRVASMYLLSQYFRAKAGGAVDLEFQGLLEIYRNMERVNRSMATRLRAAATADSTVNAIVLLDLFAKSLPLAIEDSLEELLPLFDQSA